VWRAIPLLLCGCSPAVPRDFAGSYEVLDAVAVCSERVNHTSSFSRYGFVSPVEIDVDAEGIHTIDLPSIQCPVHATVTDDVLDFADPRCVSIDREERDIHGTAIWNDDELAVELESTEYWFPLPDYWPDGLLWDCSHSYLFAPAP
jgi:hypothetical protein